MKRDGGTCRHCGGKASDVHHAIPFRFYGVGLSRFANRPENLVSLCRPCHRKADAQMQRMENSPAIAAMLAEIVEGARELQGQ